MTRPQAVAHVIGELAEPVGGQAFLLLIQPGRALVPEPLNPKQVLRHHEPAQRDHGCNRDTHQAKFQAAMGTLRWNWGRYAS